MEKENMMERKALIVVDVQNDFCPGGALAVPKGDEVVGPLNKMISFAHRNGWSWLPQQWSVVASRDWHPRVTNHFQKYGGTWSVHCVQYTQGAEFHPDLRVEGATIISKATKPDEDGYSSFSGLCDYNGQTLEQFLKSNGVTEVYVCGLATDYCVKATALDAVRMGFKTFLLVDACRAVNINPGDGDRAIAEMIEAGVSVKTTDQVMRGE